MRRGMYRHAPCGGQKILWEQAFTHVGDRHVADRCGWYVDHLASRLVFDWKPDDGPYPFVGPELDITEGEGPDETVATPWVGPDGSAVLGAWFDKSTCRRTVTQLNPTSGQDVRLLLLVCPVNDGTSNLYRVLATRNAGPGITISYRGDVSNFNFYVVDSGGNQNVSITGFGWCLLDFWWDLDGDIRAFVNGALASAAAPGGDHGNWDGVGVGDLPGGGGPNWFGDIARILVYYGDDLDHSSDYASILASVFGIRKAQGDLVPTYARSSSRIYYPLGPSGRLHVMGENAPPAGNTECLGADEQIVTKTDKNHSFVAGDVATYFDPRKDAGLTVTRVAETGDDLAALRAVFPGSDGYVIDISNTSGGTLYQRLGNAIGGGATAPSWCSIRARVISGTIRMGWQTAAGGFTEAVASLSSDYARSSDVATPGAVTDQQALEIPDGGQVRIILHCAGIGGRVPDEVPSIAAFGVSSTVTQGVLTTGHTPHDARECVEVTTVPRLNGGALPTSSLDLISRSGGATGIITLDGAGNVTTTDGTNTPSAAVSEADGVEETLRTSHGSGRLHVVQSGGNEDEAAYDGARAQSGTLILNGSPRAIRRLRVYRLPKFNAG